MWGLALSNYAISWAFELQLDNPTHKLVLVALADFADAQGESFPSLEMLAWRACASTRTVRRALVELESLGLLTRKMGLAAGEYGGKLRTNSVYVLHLPDSVQQAPVVVRRPVEVREYPEPVVDETPCQAREDTGVHTVADGSKTPSGDREDMGVHTVDRADMGDRTVRTPVSIPPTPPYKEDPPYRTPILSPQTPHDDEVAGLAGPGKVDELDDGCADGVADVEAGSVVSSAAVAASEADWGLVRSCLPGEMQALDGPGVARVAGLLRERVEAGWSHRQLREILEGQALPERVRSLAGLVCHRIGLIPVDQAPASRDRHRGLRVVEEAEPVGPVGPPVWLRARRAAIEAGLVEGNRSWAWWQAHYDAEHDRLVDDTDMESVVATEERYNDA